MLWFSMTAVSASWYLGKRRCCVSFRFANAAGVFCLLGWFGVWGVLFVLTDEEEVLPTGLGVKQFEGRVVGQECFL